MQDALISEVVLYVDKVTLTLSLIGSKVTSLTSFFKL
jgi:hypothetical protein